MTAFVYGLLWQNCNFLSLILNAKHCPGQCLVFCARLPPFLCLVHVEGPDSRLHAGLRLTSELARNHGGRRRLMSHIASYVQLVMPYMQDLAHPVQTLCSTLYVSAACALLPADNFDNSFSDSLMNRRQHI